MNDVSPPPIPIYILICIYLFIFLFWRLFFSVAKPRLSTANSPSSVVVDWHLMKRKAKFSTINSQLRENGNCHVSSQFAPFAASPTSLLAALSPSSSSSSSSSISQPVLPNWVFVMIITWLGAITPLPTGLIRTGIDTISTNFWCRSFTNIKY